MTRGNNYGQNEKVSTSSRNSEHPRSPSKSTKLASFKKDPLRCILCVVGPFLYTFAQRKTRNDKTALQTTLNRLIDLIGLEDDIIPARLWPMEPELSEFKNLKEIDKLGSLFTAQGSDKNLHGYTDIYQIIFASIFSISSGVNDRSKAKS